MKGDWTECTFEDLLDYEQPTKYIVESTKYSEDYKTPVLTAGKTFIKGYTNETSGIFNNLPTIIFDDFTTASQFVNFKFKVKSSAMKILVPTSKLVNMPFVFYAMQVNKVRNDTHKRYWISVYAKKKILLPSLVEQRAIVSKIESLFSDLDNGIANLKKAQEQLKIYRQAVLKKAFEGELYDNCKKITLKQSALKIGSGSTPKGGKSNYKKSGIPLIRSMNIHFNYIKYKDLAYIDDKQAEKLKNVIVNTGDVLLNITGASIGRVNIAPKEFQNGRVNQHVTIIRVDNEKLTSKYLKYFIQSPIIQSWIDIANYGATRQALTKSMLENLEVPLLSLPEQNQIVQEIETRLSVCDKVEQSISESLEKAKALRQSILKKAFEGKLLSEQEIEACKQEADYEPASVLLEKIKAEKLAKEQEQKKKNTKKKTKK